MKLDDLIIIIILLMLHFYPKIVIELNNPLLGKVLLLILVVMVCYIDLITGILVLFVVLLMYNDTKTEHFQSSIDTKVNKNSNRKIYREPFVTVSGDRLQSESNLRKGY